MLQLAQPFERTHASFEAASRRLRTRSRDEELPRNAVAITVGSMASRSQDQLRLQLSDCGRTMKEFRRPYDQLRY